MKKPNGLMRWLRRLLRLRCYYDQHKMEGIFGSAMIATNKELCYHASLEQCRYCDEVQVNVMHFKPK